MSPGDLLTTLDNLSHPKVLVLGDLILDRYTFGNAERVSQEAPVILLRAEQREVRLGGAANVCNMLRGLEAQPICAGVIGDDADGSLLRETLVKAGIDQNCVLVDSTRPTTVKERFIGRAQGKHQHQILRVDSEVRTPLTSDLQAKLSALLLARLNEVDVVLISDYDKGVCTPNLVRKMIDAARRARVPVLIDPIRSADYSRYRGATTMTPNRLEAGMATGIEIKTTDDAIRAGHKLCRDLDLEWGIVTLDRDGMALVDRQGRGEIFATQPRAVYDITGAGDMVLAMIGLCFAAGVPAQDACRLGNVAGGLEVEKIGVAVVPRHEVRARLRADRPAGNQKQVTLDELLRLAGTHRARGERLVFTNGCFDLLHVGHISYLQEAARLGDVLVVAVNSDDSVRKLKGPSRPVISQHDRAAMLAALACINYVLIFDQDTPHDILRLLRPEVLVKGGTYAPDQIVGHEIVASYGGQVCVTGMVEGISTTKLVNSLAQQKTQPAIEPSAISIPSPHFQTKPSNIAIAS